MSATAKIQHPAWSLTSSTQLTLLIGFGILLYLNTLGNGFVLDDQAVITQNEFVKKGITGWKEILTTFYWKGYHDSNSGLFRPLSLLMFSVEYMILPEKPWLHHLVNVVCYAFAIGLLYEWLTKLLEEKYPMLPFFTLLLFTVHPIHTEVVANIKSRDELLALLFFAASAIYIIIDLENPTQGNKVKYTIFFFLALLSKEAALLFLPVLFFMALWFKNKTWKQSIKILIPLIVVAALWLVWRSWVIYSAPEAIKLYNYEDNSLIAAPDTLHRYTTAISLIGRYLFLMIYPFNLSYDYSFSQIPFIGIFSWQFLLSSFIIALATWIVFRTRKIQPVIAFAILYFFITLSLTSNVFFLIGATFAERFLFAPSLGFCLLTAYLISMLFKQQTTLIGWGALILIIVPFSIKTFQRNKDWKSNLTLFTADIHNAPHSARVHYNYASILLNEVVPKIKNEEKQRNYYDQIVSESQKSVAIDPQHTASYVNMAVAYFKLKQYDLSLKTSLYAWHMNPSDSSFLSNIGDTYFMMGNYDSSIVFHQRSISAKQSTSGTYNHLGTAWFNKKNYKEAIKAYQEGVSVYPEDASLWLNYGNALATNLRYQEALKAFEQTHQLDPENVEVLYYIAFTYYNMGDHANAQKWDMEYKRRKGI